ncbi:hypothetical protein KGMB02408_34320 [Bacteroides faecalis]|uniref:Uncharacterized protein n=1 Tax=Bacteroides faecalis TaxID=2447885 RepID=A0A401LYC6_9BACE|nr:hypothetical protein KGMB02408_34320 [Bacteroides faecalis]
MKLRLLIYLATGLFLCGFSTLPSLDVSCEKQFEKWVIGPFVRPEKGNPVISPQPTAFDCPMQKQEIKWEESDTFNPAATVKDERSLYSIGQKTTPHRG